MSMSGPLPGTLVTPAEDTTHPEAEEQTYLDSSTATADLSDGSTLEDLGYGAPEGGES